MHVLGIVGPSRTGRRTAIERVVDHLNGGSVATVTRCDSTNNSDDDNESVGPLQHVGETTAYSVVDDGWTVSGTSLSLRDILERTAPDYDYLLVEGFDDANIPQVVLGGSDHAGRCLSEAPNGEAVDVERVVAALDSQEPFETLASLVEQVTRSPRSAYAGAVATFTGRVRAKEDTGDVPTARLEFEKYDGVADDRLDDIRSAIEARDGVHGVRLYHRTGVVQSGENIVFVVVLAGHRRQAFRAVEDGIDRLKAEVPIFKKEITVDGEFWAHDRP